MTEAHIRAAIPNRFNHLEMRRRSGVGKLRLVHKVGGINERIIQKSQKLGICYLSPF